MRESHGSWRLVDIGGKSCPRGITTEELQGMIGVDFEVDESTLRGGGAQSRSEQMNEQRKERKIRMQADLAREQQAREKAAKQFELVRERRATTWGISLAQYDAIVSEAANESAIEVDGYVFAVAAGVDKRCWVAVRKVVLDAISGPLKAGEEDRKKEAAEKSQKKKADKEEREKTGKLKLGDINATTKGADLTSPYSDKPEGCKAVEAGAREDKKNMVTRKRERVVAKGAKQASELAEARQRIESGGAPTMPMMKAVIVACRKHRSEPAPGTAEMANKASTEDVYRNLLSDLNGQVPWDVLGVPRHAAAAGEGSGRGRLRRSKATAMEDGSGESDEDREGDGSDESDDEITPPKRACQRRRSAQSPDDEDEVGDGGESDDDEGGSGAE